MSLGTASGAAPVTATSIEGSAVTLSAPSPQVHSGTTYDFVSWSDGQAQTHNVSPTSSTTFTARFAPRTTGTSTLTFDAAADAPVDLANPNTNYGSVTTLRTDAGGDPDIESFVRFLVDGLTGTVQSAKLRLFSTNGTVDGPAVYSTSAGWGESTITWNNKPAPTSGALADAGGIATGVWTEWDVTPAVTGEGLASFRLASVVTDGVNFHSREAATANLRPELVLTVLNDAFARPKGASPVRVSLVPAYNGCSSPNRTHGLPLNQGSCNPPVQSSSELTSGTPDANGRAANANGTRPVRREPRHAEHAGGRGRRRGHAVTHRRAQAGRPDRLHGRPADPQRAADHRPRERGHGRSTRHRAGPHRSGRQRPVQRHRTRRSAPHAGWSPPSTQSFPE